MPEETNSQTLPYTLRSIYLRGSRVSFQEGFDPLVSGIQLGALFRISPQQIDCRIVTQETNGQETPLKSCTFTSRFEFRYYLAENTPKESGADDGDPCAEVSADIAVDYLINLPEFPSQNDLNKWAQNNVLLHAWPYWREFCHSTLMRMSLPPTIMPMMVITPPPSVADEHKAES